MPFAYLKVRTQLEKKQGPKIKDELHSSYFRARMRY